MRDLRYEMGKICSTCSITVQVEVVLENECPLSKRGRVQDDCSMCITEILHKLSLDVLRVLQECMEGFVLPGKGKSCTKKYKKERSYSFTGK